MEDEKLSAGDYLGSITRTAGAALAGYLVAHPQAAIPLYVLIQLWSLWQKKRAKAGV